MKWAGGGGASLAALIATATMLGSAVPTAEAADRDCSDFDNRRQAQRFFKNHSPRQDPHNLDSDGDGKACEELPCPCGGGGGGGGGGGDGRPNRRDNTQSARVNRVIDGDTVEVRLNGGRPDVRLVGIDTPEVFGGEECGGRQASSSMKRMLKPGERVTLVRDRSQNNRDAFGRLLRYIEDGDRDVGKAQVGKGWAKVVKFDGRFNRIRSYRRAQHRANNRNRGVWGQCGGDFHTPA